MKIAICFYGLDPSETWKNIKITEDKCLNLWKKNVFDIDNSDNFTYRRYFYDRFLGSIQGGRAIV